MIICKNCGVELEAAMPVCPLCGEPVSGTGTAQPPAAGAPQVFNYSQKMSAPQKKFTWEIISLVLLSAIVATFLIDFIINRAVTWSEYPVAISLIIFSYVSLFAFWQQRIIIQMTGGFILSSLFLVLLDALTGGIRWSVKLGIPLLFLTSLVVTTLVTVIRRSQYKGINLVAYAFLGAAILCIGIDGVLSLFLTGLFHIEWSVIVAVCTVPVVLVLVFVHFRMKKGRNLGKTFHI